MATNTQPIAVIARLLDLTERRVQQLVREGVIPAPARAGPERGRYDLVGAVRGYVRYLRAQATQSSGGSVDFGAERARLVKAKADLAEMDAEVRRGGLLPAGAVEEAWIAMLARMRARCWCCRTGWRRSCMRRRRLPARASTSAARSPKRSGSLPTSPLSQPLILKGPEPAGEGGAQGAGDPGAATDADDQ
jgi:hypothetical protein